MCGYRSYCYSIIFVKHILGLRRNYTCLEDVDLSFIRVPCADIGGMAWGALVYSR